MDVTRTSSLFLQVTSLVLPSLSSPERPCPKAWVFNRVPSYELVGPNSIEVRNVFSRRQCQDECLRASRVVCR